MDKIVLKYSFSLRSILLVIIFLITVSCSSIEMIVIKNSTDEIIQFSGEFISKYNEINNLDFILKPGDSNLWRYEIGYMDKNILDEGLIKITLKNENKCKIVLKRDMIEKIAIKDGAWEININKNIMKCN